jgi:cytidylate kinase
MGAIAHGGPDGRHHIFHQGLQDQEGASTGQPRTNNWCFGSLRTEQTTAQVSTSSTIDPIRENYVDSRRVACQIADGRKFPD